MSDDLESEATLRLRIISDAIQATRDIDKYNDEVGFADQQMARAGKTAGKLRDQLEGVSRSASKAGDELKNATSSTDRQWDRLVARVRDAEAAYRSFRQEVATGQYADMGFDQWLQRYNQTASNPLSRVDVQAYRDGVSGSLVGDENRDLKEQLSFLDQIAASHDRNAQARAAADERDRQAQWTSIQNAKLLQSEEERITRELQQQAAMRANASRASAFYAGGIDSRLGYAPTGTRAAGTSLAAGLIAQEAASQRARRALEEYDRQLNSNTVAYKASTSVLARQLIAQEEVANSLPRMRYAMYDVATTAGIMSASLIAAEAAALAASASYESSFTSVERTAHVSEEAAESLRSQLIGLSREIPATFGDIAGVATLGAQLNIASSELTNFSEQVVQFSATAGTATDATAEGFGRIGQLLKVPVSQYRNLGSAILYAGNSSVATEQDVLNYSQRIAIAGNETGLLADQVVALSATYASLGIGLEAAQGATQRIFQQIRRDVSEGGDALVNYAAISGMTAEQFAASWNAEPQRALSALINGLSRTQDLTAALDSIGIVETREVRAMTALANNTDLYNRLLAETNQAFADGTYLASSYSKVVDDLASRWQIFLNSLAEFGAAAGDAVAPLAKDVLDTLSDILVTLSLMLQTPAGQWLAQFALGGAAVVAVLGLLVTGGALTIGTMAALRTAISSLGWSAAATGARGFMAALFGVGTAARGTAVAVNVFKTALISTGIGAVIVLLGSLAAAFEQSGQSAQTAFTTYLGSTSGLADALAADRDAYFQAAITGNDELIHSFVKLTPVAAENSAALSENAQMVANTAQVLGLTPGAYDSANGAISANTQYLGENTFAWMRNQLMQSEAFQNIVGAGKEVTDYWSALAREGVSIDDVMRIAAAQGTQAVYDYIAAAEERAIAAGVNIQRAITAGKTASGRVINYADTGFLASGTAKSVNALVDAFGGLQAQALLLGSTSSKAGEALVHAGDAGADSFSNLNDKLGGGGGGGGTTAQVRTLLDYASDLEKVWSRAFEIRFSGDQALDTITSGWQKIAQASEDARQAITDYEQKLAELTADRSIKEYWLTVAELYKDELRAAELRADLAGVNSDIAKTQKDLAKEQDKASMSLVGNSEAAIANRAEILGLVTDYQGYLRALAASGASQQELQAKSAQLKQEFIAQATQMGFSRVEVEKYAASFDDMTLAIERVPRNITVAANVNPAIQALNELEATARKVAGGNYGGINIPISGGVSDGAADALFVQWLQDMRRQHGVAMYQSAAQLEILRRNWDRGIFGNFWTGGYVGDGGKYTPKGMVHGGEFVFSKKATAFFGKDFLNTWHQAGLAGRMPTAPASSGMPPFVELGPATIQAIITGIRNDVYIDGKPIARSVSKVNVRNGILGGS
jgi:TP901 family phage tail tape measure protein